MDKLKPILAQKFWILSGLCLVLALSGWWVSTATMAKEYTDRKKIIEDAFKGIPQPGPNKNWTDKVLELNKEEEYKVKETGNYLWDQVKELMTWPEIVRTEVEKAGYQGEIDAKTRGEYRYVYDQAIIDLINIVKPYDYQTGTGLVDAPLELIPNDQWATSPIPPSTKEMRDSQEDFWMYETLLTAVANINQQFGATSIVDSKIKQILVMELRGGTPGGAPKAATGAPGGSAAMPGAMPGGMPGGMPPGSPMSGQVGGGQSGLAGGQGDNLSASFDPAEQFGPDGAEGGGSAGGGMPPGGAMMPPGGAMMPPGGGAQPGKPPGGVPGASGPGAASARKRYIDETPRYKTRGFYMEVVMDHSELPAFIGELSDSRWPLKVIRVQQVDRDLSDIGGGSVVGAGMGASMGKSPMGGMGGNAMRSPPIPRNQIADMEDDSPRGRPGMAQPRMQPKARFGETGTGEEAISLTTVLADPSLVNVALSGIITIYLPPDAGPTAQAGTPGAAGVPAPGVAPATTTSPPAVSGTAPTVPGATTTPAGGAAAPGTPAATVATPAEAPLPGASPAPGTTPPAAAKAGDPAAPATTPPTDAKPAATGGTPPAAPATPTDKTTPASAAPAAPATPAPPAPAGAKPATGK